MFFLFDPGRHSSVNGAKADKTGPNKEAEDIKHGTALQINIQSKGNSECAYVFDLLNSELK